MAQKIFFRLKQTTGQSLVELIIALGLMTLILPATLTVYLSSTQGKVQRDQRQKATQLLRETEEAIRVIREDDWDNISLNGTYHPEINAVSWSLAAGQDTIGFLTREIIIEDLYRNNLGEIVTSGGYLDPSSKKVTCRVSWTNPLNSSIESVLYLTRYLDNAALFHTTDLDFQPGEFTNTEVANEEGGEVVLSGSGHADWCQPQDYILTELNLEHHARSRVVRAIEGKAFTGTDFANLGVFSEIEITQDDPPAANVIATVPGYDTNDIFIDENYAYIATDDMNRDVVIIDLNTDQQVGYFDDSYPWGTAQGIYVKDDVGYVTIGPNLHSFDLSNKTGERPELDHIWLSPWSLIPAIGSRLQGVDDYIYVALDFGFAEMRIINVSDPDNLDGEGYADVNGNRGQDIFVSEDGERVYLATDNSSSRDELFIIDTESKNGNRPLISSYNATGMSPRGIAVVTFDRLLLVGTSAEEYQVIDISDEENPSRCGGININSGVYGVAGVLEHDNEAFSYIVTGDDDAEFKIIKGGPGGAGTAYPTEGSYESVTFDLGSPAVVNYAQATFNLPTQTNGRFQLAIAESNSGSCDGVSFEFLGPDGTSNTFYDPAGPVYINNDGLNYENPGQCLRYKVFLSTDNPSETAKLEEITINYSP